MKSVLISIRPEWCEKIISGAKTIEVRKTRPKIETPFKCHIYCTKSKPLLTFTGLTTRSGIRQICEYGKYAKPSSSEVLLRGKVVGEFVCDSIEIWNESDMLLINPLTGHSYLCELSQMSLKELNAHCDSSKELYAWSISDLKIYDEPKELSEFSGYCRAKKDCFADIVRQCNDMSCDWKCNPITRAPQSWCYVEEL